MKIKISFFAVMLFLALLAEHSIFSLAAALAALTHELGHLATAALCRIRMKECVLGIYGAGLVPDSGIYSYRREILLCAAGPLTNFFLGFTVLWLTLGQGSEWAQSFAVASFSLGGMNLLPIRGFDGGRILYARICLAHSPLTAHRLLTVCSFLCVFFLWCCSVYCLLRAAASLSLFVFSLSLFCRLFLNDDTA